MKRATGVTKRPGSSVFQWGIKAPADLRRLYPTQWAHRQSLQTADLREANATASGLQAKWLARFADERRALNPVRMETVSAELGAAVAQGVRRMVLAADDNMRDFAEGPLGLLAREGDAHGKAALAIAHAKGFLPVTLDARTPNQLAAVSRFNDRALERAVTAWTTRDLHVAAQWAQASARNLGVVVDWTAPEARPVLVQCLKELQQARAETKQRDAGAIVETPPVPQPARAVVGANAPRFLRDLLPQWKASKTRKAQTEQAAEKALALYEKATGNPPIATLTRAHGVAFKSWLLAQGTASGTAADRLAYVKGFLNFAAVELEEIPRNPWSGLGIEFATETPRRPWSEEQLALLVNRPLFSAYSLPTAERAGKDAAYWLLLLGMFTGARVSELAQLRVSDVATIDAVALLRITNEGAGQSIKSKAGRRDVPLHDELLRLGFLEYAAAIRETGAASLWPALRTREAKAGDYFSRWFAEVRKAKGEHALPDFHSFRHTVRSKLASAGVAEPTIDTLMGHEVKGSMGARTYTQRPPQDLKRAIDLLAYPSLVLPKVFPPRGWSAPSAKPLTAN